MRLNQFFEGEDGRLSMTRLMVFLSFGPASWVVVNESSSETLGWYLGAYVLGYVGGKGADAIMVNKQPQVSAVGNLDVSGEFAVTSHQPLASKSRPTGRGKK